MLLAIHRYGGIEKLVSPDSDMVDIGQSVRTIGIVVPVKANREPLSSERLLLWIPVASARLALMPALPTVDNFLLRNDIWRFCRVYHKPFHLLRVALCLTSAPGVELHACASLAFAWMSRPGLFASLGGFTRYSSELLDLGTTRSPGLVVWCGITCTCQMAFARMSLPWRPSPVVLAPLGCPHFRGYFSGLRPLV